jgi:transposase
MDGTPIHMLTEVDKMITSREYKCAYLPPYCSDHNPIEQLCSVVKNKIKHGKLDDKENLKSRISDACDDVPIRHIKASIQHSVGHFESCLSKVHI